MAEMESAPAEAQWGALNLTAIALQLHRTVSLSRPIASGKLPAHQTVNSAKAAQPSPAIRPHEADWVARALLA